MSKAKTDYDLGEIRSLSCPNGKPLSLVKMDDGRWAIGCLTEACSPIVHDLDANKVLQRLLDVDLANCKSRC